ncbi:FtsX-like permease family protein [Candidatus Gottesmanbacteria bacterium]|nr:FtsX-like permease family protein [Candidatus Gottesmanbacteria bacterium]
MQYFFFIVQSAFEDFRRNKLRTLLTSLGILIGISSVVLLISLGLGLRKYIDDQFQSLGANLIMVSPGKILAGGLTSGSAFMSTGQFDEKDVEAVKKIKNLTAVVPMFVTFSEVKGISGADSYEIIAATPEVFPLMNFEIDTGRLFDRSDADRGNKVIVLGSKPAEKLFGTKNNALGKIAKVKDQGYKVIGILESKGGGGFGPGIDDHLFIPFKSAYSFNPSKKFWGIYAKAADEAILAQTKEEIKKSLLKRYHDDDFSVNDQMEFLTVFDTIFNMINMVLIAIAAISLVVGGIGIMNIMYVSVVERVKEIGVRRSFGARKSDILSLFLIEAIILSLAGGLLGLSLSYLVVLLLQKFFPAYINLQAVLLSMGVSSVIGIVFGVFPARSAANLSPVEAIRSEQ